MGRELRLVMLKTTNRPNSQSVIWRFLVIFFILGARFPRLRGCKFNGDISCAIVKGYCIYWAGGHNNVRIRIRRSIIEYVEIAFQISITPSSISILEAALWVENFRYRRQFRQELQHDVPPRFPIDNLGILSQFPSLGCDVYFVLYSAPCIGQGILILSGYVFYRSIIEYVKNCSPNLNNAPWVSGFLETALWAANFRY